MKKGFMIIALLITGAGFGFSQVSSVSKAQALFIYYFFGPLVIRYFSSGI